jgi:hypothetical protein
MTYSNAGDNPIHTIGQFPAILNECKREGESGLKGAQCSRRCKGGGIGKGICTCERN